MSVTEEIRLRFLPARVSVLFVGESPPAGGTFFYNANSKLYEATREAFRIAAPDLVRGQNFLDAFQALGCFLDDLCLEPVNHLKLDNPLAKSKRLHKRVEGEAALAARLAEWKPSELVVVMLAIEENVRRAAATAGLATKLNKLPFPGRPQHRERFVDELVPMLKRFRGRGLLLTRSL